MKRYPILLAFCLALFFSALTMAEAPVFETANKADDHYLEDQQIYGMTADSKGTMYIVTSKGICIKQKDSSFIFIYSSDQGQFAKNIAIGMDGTVYAGTQEGLLIGKKDQAGHYHFTFNKIANIGSNGVSSLVMDNKNGMLYIGGQGVFYLETRHHWFGRSDTYSFYLAGLDSEVVTCLAVDSTGQLYVGTQSHGLFMQTTGVSPFGEVPNTVLPIRRVVSLFIDASGFVYLGTDNGFLAIQIKMMYENGSALFNVTSVMQPDSNKSFYAGKNRVIVSIVVSRQGRIFIGDCGGSIDEPHILIGNKLHINPTYPTYTLSPMEIPGLLFYETATSAYPTVYFDEDTSVLYVGTAHGLLAKKIPVATAQDT